MKSHTGGATAFGQGIIIPKSTKQKLNTRSLTEDEIVGASDYLPDAIWLLRFLKYQGYKIDKSRFFQDNESAIKIQQNGKKSGSRRTRHLDIRYFFLKDRFEQENIKVRYCKTEEMLGDFFTKPLQGARFHRMRTVVMGYDSICSLHANAYETMKNEEGVDPRKSSDYLDSGDVRLSSHMNVKKRAEEQVGAATSYADVVWRGVEVV